MPRYPQPGFLASRLIHPTDGHGDFGYRDEDARPVRRRPASTRPHRTRGPAPTPVVSTREAERIEREAMKRLKARRGCPDWVAPAYVQALRNLGEWYEDRVL